MSKELKTILLIGGVVVAIVAILVAVSRYQQDNKPVATEALVREDSHFRGGVDAAAVLVEFGDFQCPACGQAEPILNQLQSEYGDQLKFVFRHFPLSFHKNAAIAAQASEAAAVQGKFWEMHDLLFTNQAAWSELSDPMDTFASYAQQLGLDVDTFRSDVTSQQVEDKVRQDQRDGEALGVSATPTLYLNGQKLEGYGYNDLKTQIDQILAEANAQSVTPEATQAPTE